MNYKRQIFCGLAVIACLAGCSWFKRLTETCFVLTDLEGNVLQKEGNCDVQESPCSTFKVALALMGFDAGVLKSKTEPQFDYDDRYPCALDIWKQPHNPKMWIENSCVWYSQKIIAALGAQQFQRYVHNFDYGNQDISGSLPEDKEYTKPWLCSSLKISPIEHVAFLKKLLRAELPVSLAARSQTQKLLFVGDLHNGWQLYGKTGGGRCARTHRSLGWFVGGVTKGQKTLIFACLLKGDVGKSVVSGTDAKKMAIRKLLRHLSACAE